MSTISTEEAVMRGLEADAGTARAGIVAGETYFSPFSLRQRKGRRLVPGSDEDAVTMAVEAARRALELWEGETGSVDGLYVALDHGSDVVEANAQAVREALGLAIATKVVTFAGDLGGLDALQAAIAAVDADSLSTVLVIAAEQAADENDRRNAAAAGLIVQACDDPESAVTLEEIGRAGGLTHARWRNSELEPQEPDFRFLSHRYRQVVDAAVFQARARGDLGLDEVIFSGGAPSDQRSARAGNFTDIAAQGGGGRTSIDYGVAGPVVALLDGGRELAGQTVGLVAHGGGQAVFLRLRLPAAEEEQFGTGHPPAETVAPVPASTVGPALALPAESPFFHRAWNETLRLEAARCENCQNTMYPPSQRPICSRCGSSDMQLFPLPRRGTIYTFVDNRFNPAGFPARVVSVLGELEGGYRYWAPMPPETRGEELSIGQPVELRLRRFTNRHGLPVYALKYVEAESTGNDVAVESHVKGTR